MKQIKKSEIAKLASELAKQLKEYQLQNGKKMKKSEVVDLAYTLAYKTCK